MLRLNPVKWLARASRDQPTKRGFHDRQQPHATWEVSGDDVVVRPLRPLARAERDAVLAEGEAAQRFVADGPGDVRMA